MEGVEYQYGGGDAFDDYAVVDPRSGNSFDEGGSGQQQFDEERRQGATADGNYMYADGVSGYEGGPKDGDGEFDDGFDEEAWKDLVKKIEQDTNSLSYKNLKAFQQAQQLREDAARNLQRVYDRTRMAMEELIDAAFRDVAGPPNTEGGNNKAGGGDGDDDDDGGGQLQGGQGEHHQPPNLETIMKNHSYEADVEPLLEVVYTGVVETVKDGEEESANSRRSSNYKSGGGGDDKSFERISEELVQAEDSIAATMTDNENSRKDFIRSLEESKAQFQQTYRTLMALVLDQQQQSHRLTGNDENLPGGGIGYATGTQGGDGVGGGEPGWDDLFNFDPSSENMRLFAEAQDMMKHADERFQAAMAGLEDGFRECMEQFEILTSEAYDMFASTLDDQEDDIRAHLFSNLERRQNFERNVQEQAIQSQSFFARLLNSVKNFASVGASVDGDGGIAAGIGSISAMMMGGGAANPLGAGNGAAADPGTSGYPL